MSCQNDGKMKAQIDEIGNPWQTLSMKTEILKKTQTCITGTEKQTNSKWAFECLLQPTANSLCGFLLYALQFS